MAFFTDITLILSTHVGFNDNSVVSQLGTREIFRTRGLIFFTRGKKPNQTSLQYLIQKRSKTWIAHVRSTDIELRTEIFVDMEHMMTHLVQVPNDFGSVLLIFHPWKYHALSLVRVDTCTYTGFKRSILKNPRFNVGLLLYIEDKDLNKRYQPCNWLNLFRTVNKDIRIKNK